MYTYSGFGECQPNNTKTQTVTGTSPAGCSGTPVTSQSCTYNAPVASAGLSLKTPTSMPVPYGSSVTLGVSYQNAYNCNLYKSGSLYSGNVGVGNVGVGSITSDTGFSLNCTASSNTTGTPSGSITVTVAAQAPNLTVSPSLNRTGDVPLGAELVLSGSITNTGGTYSGSNEWEYSTNNANWYSFGGAGSGTSVTEKRWTPTSLGGPYYFRLCVNPPAGKSCNGAGSLTMVTPPKTDQTITFAALANKVMGNSAFTVGASAPGGTVTFSAPATNPSNGAANQCSVSGSLVSINGVGRCTIRASQAGNANYNAAASVDQWFTVSQRAPSVNWSAPAAITYPTPLSGAQLNATAVPSAGTFAYTPALGAVMNAGLEQKLSVLFTPSDSTYSATIGEVYLTVNKANQTVTYAPPANKTYGDAAFTVTATAPSTGAITYSVPVTTNICSVGSTTGTITLLAAGTCTLRASSAADTNYNAASKDASITVASPMQALTTVISPSFPFTSPPVYGGTVSCNGITCAASYLPGTVVNLTANPSAGFSFKSWSGDGTGATTRSVTMNTAKSV
ncbi:MAG: hypothetical protein Q7R93_00610, partial [bacterium]|nr:hypothetical protein [bacterium]